MGIFHTTGENPRIPIIPDALLSLGVERTIQPFGRPSYIKEINRIRRANF